MNLKALIKRILRPAADRFLASIAARVGSELNLETSREFDLHHFLALRALAGRGDHHVVLPYDSARPRQQLSDLKIGFFGNIANNAYNFVRCLRRLGHQAELVIEDGVFDAFLMNRPFWEDLEVSCESYDDGLGHEQGWVQPHYVRRVAYDPEMQARFQGRYSAIPEVQGLYKQAFRIELAPDAAFVLAQQMGHWPFLLAMGRYDLIQFSGAPISLGPFCPKPYVVFPTGSDLFISPFEETTLGMLMRAGYRKARHVLACETNYPEYLERLGLSVPYTFTPLMIDTETYVPGKGGDLRAQWTKATGGAQFILSVCRQSWQWKGNDRLIRAFQSFSALPENLAWRLVLMEWGPDVARTKVLIEELGLRRLVVWQKLASKPLLRKCQQAADVVVDQFVMAGYGTSVLESMAAGTPILMARQPRHCIAYLAQQPPFIEATEPDEIAQALVEATHGDVLACRGRESLQWVQDCHGYKRTADAYLAVYRSVLGLHSTEPLAAQQTEGRVTPEVPAHQTGLSPSSRETLNELWQLHRELRQTVKKKFDRGLPLADELTDRWERAQFLGFGKGASIYDSAVVIGNVTVGTDTWIGPSCILDGSGGLEIGSSCSIASGCHIYSHDSVDWAVSGGKSAYQRRPTRIGDACYIGPHSVVAAGVTVGSHCLVSALSFVNRDVPDYSVVAGAPARVIGHVRVAPDGSVTRIYDERSGTP